MEMLNRAFEDAADFADMMRKLKEPGRHIRPAVVMQRKPLPPKRPGENRRDYRARVLATQGDQ